MAMESDWEDFLFEMMDEEAARARMSHTVEINKEKVLISQDDLLVRYRAICTCGWSQTSMSIDKVEELSLQHISCFS